MPRASIDCSFLAHALIPSQQTSDGVEALSRLVEERWTIFTTPAVYLEFSGLVLKLRNQRQLTDVEAERFFVALAGFNAVLVPFTPALFARAWRVARDLGQSDTFDALGYAAAEEAEAEFWTSDARFRNAAANLRLPRITFVP